MRISDWSSDVCSSDLGPGAHCDHDLLVRDRRAVAGGEHSRHRGVAAVVDHDLAPRGELDRALEPLGVRQEADLHEDAVEVDLALLAAGAIVVGAANDLPAVAEHLGANGRTWVRGRVCLYV